MKATIPWLSILSVLTTAPAQSLSQEGFVLKAGEGEQLINGVVAKVSPTVGSERSILAEQTFPPGGTTGLHVHDQGDEIIYIVTGNGSAVLDDTSHPITEGDTIFIPRGTTHEVSNPQGPEHLVVVFFMDSPELVHELRAIKEMLSDDPDRPLLPEEREILRSIGGSRLPDE